MGSMRRAGADIGFNSEIDIDRSSKPAPNITPYARRWKVQPRDEKGRVILAHGAEEKGITAAVLRGRRGEEKTSVIPELTLNLMQLG